MGQARHMHSVHCEKKYHGAGTEAGGSAPAPRHLNVGDLHVVYCAAEMVFVSAALDTPCRACNIEMRGRGGCALADAIRFGVALCFLAAHGSTHSSACDLNSHGNQ